MIEDMLEKWNEWEVLDIEDETLVLSESKEYLLNIKNIGILNIVVEENVVLVLLEDIAHDCEMSIFLKKGSQLHYVIERKKEQEVLNIKRKITLEQEAKCVYVERILDATNCDSQVEMHLQGQGAEAKILSRYAVMGENQFNLAQHVYHHVGETKSLISTRAIGEEKGQCRYTAGIHIDTGAVGSDAMQEADLLLCSPQTKIHALPLLEIEEKDVQCRHGVRMRKIDEEALFYLTSRGLSEENAITLVKEGQLVFDE